MFPSLIRRRQNHQSHVNSIRFLRIQDILLLSSAIIVIFFPLHVQSQVGKDPTDFSKVSGWADYRSCVQNCMNYAASGWGTGCSTSKCLCSEQVVFEKAMAYVTKCAGDSCGDEEGVAATKKILNEYCEGKGYTYEDVGKDDGASTTIIGVGDGTGPTVTMVITEKVTVLSDSGKSEAPGKAGVMPSVFSFSRHDAAAPVFWLLTLVLGLNII